MTAHKILPGPDEQRVRTARLGRDPSSKWIRQSWTSWARSVDKLSTLVEGVGSTTEGPSAQLDRLDHQQRTALPPIQTRTQPAYLSMPLS
jgi:hypothetical protein